MTKEKLGIEPAFPNDNTMDCQPPYCYGMSMHFYAACAAMQGILANQDKYRVSDYQSELYRQKLVEQSCQFADELLRQGKL
ncbi:MAG: hypothetical protein WC319_12505 [Candidatus Paceibacterota bacterium]|jgi:hypothetical protein